MAKFVRAPKEQGAAGTFGAKAVNFVKDFIVKHKMNNDPISRHVVDAKQVVPPSRAAGRTGLYNCNF